LLTWTLAVLNTTLTDALRHATPSNNDESCWAELVSDGFLLEAFSMTPKKFETRSIH
jgi:hypothetical protein